MNEWLGRDALYQKTTARILIVGSVIEKIRTKVTKRSSPPFLLQLKTVLKTAMSRPADSVRPLMAHAIIVEPMAGRS